MERDRRILTALEIGVYGIYGGQVRTNITCSCNV